MVFTTGTDPLNWDTDGNGQSDLADFYAANPPEENPGITEEEADQNHSDTTPQDSDGDGLSDDFEANVSFTDPLNGDSDGNGRSDYDDHYYPVAEPDADGDGVPDWAETSDGSDPYSVDSDGDGLTDGEEQNIYFTDPNHAHSLSSQFTDWYLVDQTDSDGGGIPDRIESYYGMDPYDANDDLYGDLDGDGVCNLDAYNQGWGLDSNIPQNYDRDGDGMTDVWETSYGLNPDDPSDASQDPDGDGYDNLAEFQNGTDPWVAENQPSLGWPEEPEMQEEEAEAESWIYDAGYEEPQYDYEDEGYWNANRFYGCVGLALACISVCIAPCPLSFAGLWFAAAAFGTDLIDYFENSNNGSEPWF